MTHVSPAATADPPICAPPPGGSAVCNVLPAFDEVAQLTDTESAGGMLELCWEILEGLHAGVTVWTREKEPAGARRALDRMCDAVGAAPTDNAADLLLQPMRIKMVVADGPGGAENRIIGYRHATPPTAGSVASGMTRAAPAADAASAFDPWERFPVPAFPLDTLPPVIRNFVEFKARNIGVDPSAVAMAALAACSGAIDHGFSLKMMENGDWWANPRLWVLLVGPPSSKKSPAISACLKPLQAREVALWKQHDKAMAAWQQAKEAGEKSLPPIAPPRFTAMDITSEKLGDLLSRQDRGILVVQDELAAWIGAMDKYSGGGKGAAADRGFWLVAYNGGPFRVDRIQRGSVAGENLSASILGGIQPGRLAELGNLSSDGLLQRFLPVMLAAARMPEDIADDGAVAAYDEAIVQLAGLVGSRQLMTPDAMRVAKELREYLFTLENMSGLGDHFSSFVGKLQGVHGSLSMILHLAADPSHATYDQVAAETVAAAAKIIRDFIIPNAIALYQMSSDRADWETTRALCSFILTSPKPRFVTSDFTAGVRSMRGLSVFDAARIVSPLVAGGWLVEDARAIPTKAWTIVPGLRDQFAVRRAEEAMRKTEAFNEIKRLAKGGMA